MLSRLLCRKAVMSRSISTFSKFRDKKDFSQSIKYTDSHEWLCYQWDCTKMGLTKKAIDEMGELIYLEFTCKKGDIVKENEELVSIESVKSVESINAPYECVVLGTNDEINLDELNSNPGCVNNWIIKIDRIP